MNCVLLICCAFDSNGLELDALDLLLRYIGEKTSNQMVWRMDKMGLFFQFSKVLSIFLIYILFMCNRNKLVFDRFVDSFSGLT